MFMEPLSRLALGLHPVHFFAMCVTSTLQELPQPRVLSYNTKGLFWFSANGRWRRLLLYVELGSCGKFLTTARAESLQREDRRNTDVSRNLQCDRNGDGLGFAGRTSKYSLHDRHCPATTAHDHIGRASRRNARRRIWRKREWVFSHRLRRTDAVYMELGGCGGIGITTGTESIQQRRNLRHAHHDNSGNLPGDCDGDGLGDSSDTNNRELRHRHRRAATSHNQHQSGTSYRHPKRGLCRLHLCGDQWAAPIYVERDRRVATGHSAAQ